MLAAQETLTPEVASVLKHSLSLARRRSHGEISPLHVVEALLSSGPNLLRNACEKSLPFSSSSSSLPLQCRALVVCLNVALNRLPLATYGNYSHPEPSPALIAALLRQGSEDVKVELDQLVLSILDDPTVNMVMKEAGFSSASVKACLEDASVSSAVFPPFSGNPRSEITGCLGDGASASSPVFPPSGNPRLQVKEDVKRLIDVLMGNKSRRNCVIVGDSVLTEGVFAGFLGKVVVEEDVPADLKSAKFIHFQFSSAELSFMKREEVELNVCELRRIVDATVAASGGGGVIIYAGDLRWTAEVPKIFCNNRYNPVDHLVGEIGRLLRSYSNSNAKVWLLATASIRTYSSQPPLDAQWLLHPLFVPSAVLGLKLNPASWRYTNMGDSLSEKGNGCQECKVLEEAGLHKSSSLAFPKNQGGKDNILKRKGSSISEELYPQRHDEGSARQGFFGKNKQSYGSQTIISFTHKSFLKNKQSASSVPQFRRQQSCNIEFNGESPQNVSTTLSLGNSPVSDDASTDKSTEEMIMSLMCILLQEDVPWQSSSTPTIVRTLMRSKELKRATWFLIQGDDIVGKRRLARGIAQVLHGSSDSLIQMNLRNTSGKNCEMLKRTLVDRHKLVLLIENVDFLDVELSEFLEHVFRYGMGTLWNNLERNSYHPIFILTKSDDNASSDLVVQMEILVSKEASSATLYRDSTVLNKIPRKEHNSPSFLHLIKTLVFNTNPVEVKKMREMFLSNITGSFEQVFGTLNLDCFSVQEKVVDQVFLGSATFLHSVFQEWLKRAFQSSLKSIRFSKEGNEQFKIRLCLVGGGDQSTGFHGSCLPMHIPIRYVD